MRKSGKVTVVAGKMLCPICQMLSFQKYYSLSLYITYKNIDDYKCVCLLKLINVLSCEIFYSFHSN